MVYLEFFVEEPSMEMVLNHLVPRILDGKDYEMVVRTFNGKMDLLNKLPNYLKPYPKFIQHNHYLFILIDRDSQDCIELKHHLEGIVKDAKLVTRTANPQHYRVVNRIVIEELEAWYFGDVDAIKKAYPRYNPPNPAKYRNPDQITGGTCDALGRELVYYYPKRLPKIHVAENIAPHMNPHINQSKSFQVFRDALLALFSPKSQ